MSAAVPLFRRPFYFLRHGETEANARMLVAGSLDTELTETGRAQAREAAAALAKEPITAVYSSPLKRARETAAPVAERLGLPVIVVPELAERNWGVLEGKPRGSRLGDRTPEGGEAVEAFRRRILGGLARVDGDVPLIVGHSGVFRVLCHTLALEHSESPVMNCLPLRIEPGAANKWGLTPISGR